MVFNVNPTILLNWYYVCNPSIKILSDAKRHDDIKEALAHSIVEQIDEQHDLGHGRIKKCTCSIIADMAWICKNGYWQDLQAIIEVNSERTIKVTGAKGTQVHHYIGSPKAREKKINKAIRDHWSVENGLY